MSDITVLGLGMMGSALARAMHGAGIDLTVWNRSPDRLTPYVDSGVPAAVASRRNRFRALPIL